MKSLYIEIVSIVFIIISSLIIFYILKQFFSPSNSDKKSISPFVQPAPLIVPPPNICNSVSNSTFTIENNWTGKDMIPSEQKGWEFFVGDDPTRGHVSYNKWSYLLKPYGDSLRIDVDSKPISNGRRSVRLMTNDKYTANNKTYLFIIDAEHIPEGLSVWPAFWLVGIPDNKINGKQISNWACYGEIDIIEGCNSVKEDADSNINTSTLHTNLVPDADDCIQTMFGITNKNCNASTSDLYTCGCSGDERCPNQGCGIKKGLFGNAFNNSGGGVYACQLDNNGIVTIWFFRRDSIPENILCGKPDPTQWPKTSTTSDGKMTTVITFEACPKHFQNLRLVINTTICGEWAGNTFKNGKNNGKYACEAFSVDPNNRYEDAYWYINYIKVFSKPIPSTPPSL